MRVVAELITLRAVFRRPLIHHRIGAAGGFRLRGKDVLRVEGFSDAVFGFALTLLVIALEVPRNYDDLLDIFRGLPSFAICLAILLQLWYGNYRFFRRFGLEDRTTIFLNCVLLFLVMCYVYPLKYLFVMTVGFFTGIVPNGYIEAAQRMTLPQVSQLFVIYGLGFLAVCAVQGFMYARAHRMRHALDLNEVERTLTRAEIARQAGLGAVALASVLIASLAPGRMLGFAGYVYCLIGVVEFVVPFRFGKKVEEIEKRSAPTQPV